MLFINYIIFILKQLVRIKIAFFFTLIFPIILYFVYGHADQSVSLIIFAHFMMQSAMLQSVGMFISAHKNSAWGDYLTTLPAPRVYPIFSTIIAMYLIGLFGLLLICMINFFLYQTFSLTAFALLIISISLGSFPLGALGYLIGIRFDPLSARNILLLTNLFFLFISFVGANLQTTLSYFLLPNAWLYFSKILVLEKNFNLYSFLVLSAYFLIFTLLIVFYSQPKKQYANF